MSLLAFTPSTSLTVAVTGTQQTVAVLGSGHYLRFVNTGGGNVYVLFFEPGQTTPTVSTGTSMLIPAGAIEVFSCATDRTQVAVLGDASITLNVTRGDGQ